MTQDGNPQGVFEHARRLAAGGPFGAAILLGVLLAVLPADRAARPGVHLAVALMLATVALVLLLPWRRLPPGAELVPPLLYLVAVGILRETGGAAASAFAPLAMLPVFWVAVYGTRTQLATIIAAVAVLFIAPVLVMGGADYPGGEWRRGVLWLAISLIIGFTVQRLVAQLVQQEREARTIITSSGDAFISMDDRDRIVEWNPQAERVFGWTREEALGRTVAETVVPPEHRERHWRGLRRFLATGEGRLLGRAVEIDAQRRDGGRVPVELTISAVPTARGHTFHAFVRDVTARHRAERLFAAQHRVSQVLAESATLHDAVNHLLRALGATFDCEVGAFWKVEPERAVLRCGEVWERAGSDYGSFVALTRATELPSGTGLPGRAWSSRQPICVPDIREEPDLPRAEEALEAGLRSGMAIPVGRAGDVLGVLELFSVELADDVDELIAVMAAISAQLALFIDRVRRSEMLSRAEAIARTDALTGLANRRAWDEELPLALDRARRHIRPVSLALLDLDHFKDYNDRRGHLAGDWLLKEAAIAWGAELRTLDVLARYGGEEFAVLLPDCDLDQAMEIVERLRAVTPRGETVSAGVACWNGTEDPEQLVARADDALYRAKRAGRDRAMLDDVACGPALDGAPA